jgi:hypothetical protein
LKVFIHLGIRLLDSACVWRKMTAHRSGCRKMALGF